MSLEISDLNILMNLVTEINSKNPHDLTDAELDTLILYHRRNRARKAAGEKLITSTATPKVDVMSILNLSPTKPKAAPTGPTLGITRRI